MVMHRAEVARSCGEVHRSVAIKPLVSDSGCCQALPQPQHSQAEPASLGGAHPALTTCRAAGQRCSHELLAAPQKRAYSVGRQRHASGGAMQHCSSAAPHLQQQAVACSSVPVAHSAVSRCCRHPAADAACRIAIVVGALSSAAARLLSCRRPGRFRCSSSSSATACTACSAACGVWAVHHRPYGPLVTLQHLAAPATTVAVLISKAGQRPSNSCWPLPHSGAAVKQQTAPLTNTAHGCSQRPLDPPALEQFNTQPCTPAPAWPHLPPARAHTLLSSNAECQHTSPRSLRPHLPPARSHTLALQSSCIVLPDALTRTSPHSCTQRM